MLPMLTLLGDLTASGISETGDNSKTCRLPQRPRRSRHLPVLPAVYHNSLPSDKIIDFLPRISNSIIVADGLPLLSTQCPHHVLLLLNVKCVVICMLCLPHMLFLGPLSHLCIELPLP